MIYFDNAATSYPKPKEVYKAVFDNLKYASGNPGRSSHALAAAAAESLFSTRESVCRLLGIDDPERVVFCYNATEALNLAIKTRITEKCHIITSDIEHNSVVRPLHALGKRLGVEYSVFDSDGDIERSIRALVRPDTKGIVSSLMSNVTGKIIDISVLSAVSRKLGLFLILDASQILGHRQINLKSTPCDVLCGPGHKGLYGIMGVGFAVFGDKTRSESFIEGGSGSESLNPEMPIYLPDSYEAGTPGVSAITSLDAGIKYVMNTGIDCISRTLTELTWAATDRLCSLKNVSLHAASNGIVSFNLGSIPSVTLAEMLELEGIATRGGYHCAPSAHRKLGTIGSGAVRVSFSHKNKVSEIDKLYRILKNIEFLN